MGCLLARTLNHGPYDPNKSSLVTLSNGFAAMSAVCRSIGLCRWLFVMPTLARMYTSDDVTETTKEAIDVVYEAVNGWGGGIGELLGVSLFAASWVVCISILLIQSKKWPSWLGYLGFLVAIDLALNLLEMSILDIDMGINLTLAVVFLHLWLAAIGVFILEPSCTKRCMPSSDESEEGEQETTEAV